MGSHLYDDLPDNAPIQGNWSAIIATSPADFSDLVDVVIPGIDENLRWQNCKWNARNSIDLPIRGNECLINFDENNQVWVVMWWPF